LLKKKLEGGIYLEKIGVRSFMNTTSTLRFPLLKCKGVIDWIGLPISVDDYFPVVSIADFLVVDNGFYSPFFIKALI
jgi:hypothetical protein